MTSQDDESNDHGYSSEDAMGSEDGEYDLEPPIPPPHREATSESPCSTQSSSTYGKRKASVEPDDYNENPELYGLRRSVCLSDTRQTNITDFSAQGRARPTRRIVGAPCTFTYHLLTPT